MRRSLNWKRLSVRVGAAEKAHVSIFGLMARKYQVQTKRPKAASGYEVT